MDHVQLPKPHFSRAVDPPGQPGHKSVSPPRTYKRSPKLYSRREVYLFLLLAESFTDPFGAGLTLPSIDPGGPGQLCIRQICSL